MSDRLSEIEGRLAGATPGVWKLWGMDVLADQDGTSNVDTAVPVATTHMLIDDKPRTFDADLIANAPADLAALVKFAREVEVAEAKWRRRGSTDFQNDVRFRTEVLAARRALDVS